MAEAFNLKEMPKFETPEEEIAFLRERVAEKEKELKEKAPELEKVKKEEVAEEAIKEYKKVPPEKVLPPERVIPEEEAKGIKLRLSPEPHDVQMSEFLSILLNKGIKNTLSVVGKMQNPHLEDDFHRFLVQYLFSAGRIPGLKERQPLFKALNMVLFEVALPERAKDEEKDFKAFIGAMEQFYAGMLSAIGEKGAKHYYSLEIALPEATEQVMVYAAVPRARVELFEKQILAFYPDAEINEVPNDYNIFNFEGETVGAFAEFTRNDALPLKTYEDFDHDPLNAFFNVFSKMKREGEGAAIQFVISPPYEDFIQSFKFVLEAAEKGEKIKKSAKIFGDFDREFENVTKELLGGFKAQTEEKKDEEKEKRVDSELVEHITKKMQSTILKANIRVIASAESRARAQDIMRDLESVFHQFSATHGNSIVFKRVSDRRLPRLLHNFSFRIPDYDSALPLNLKELSTLFHFPAGVSPAPQLKRARAKVAPAPMEMGREGILLGVNNYRGRETEIFFKPKDRMRHFYVIGQTGTGKTNILKNMIKQDIARGEGVCFIDPHGSDVQEILAHIPEERVDDVIYFDPAYTSRPMGLNMLEFDERFPEQKTFVVDELVGIFDKLYDLRATGGPMFEQYFRNSALLVLEHLESGHTLLEIGRVLADKAFRDMKLSHSRNPTVIQFWKNAEATSGEAGLENMVPYITGKFDVFVSNEIMRPVISQEKSSFNFRKIMDEGKILLVNLSKGRLGEINANLIGLVLVGKILMAALSRVDMPEEKRKPFYLYIDEFQNVTTDSISQILSEARKYQLSLNIAHQFIAQLDESIKDAVFGNVGSMASFRVSSDDAEILKSQFEPVFSPADIMNLDNFNAYVKMLIDGQPAKPFNIKTLPPSAGRPELVEKLKELSYLKYGRPREEIEEEIMARYK